MVILENQLEGGKLSKGREVGQHDQAHYPCLLLELNSMGNALGFYIENALHSLLQG